MLCRANVSNVSHVGLDAAPSSMLSFFTGGVSFCSGVGRARGSCGEPKVTPPALVYTLLTLPPSPSRYQQLLLCQRQGVHERLQRCLAVAPPALMRPRFVILREPRVQVGLELL